MIMHLFKHFVLILSKSANIGLSKQGEGPNNREGPSISEHCETSRRSASELLEQSPIYCPGK